MLCRRAACNQREGRAPTSACVASQKDWKAERGFRGARALGRSGLLAGPPGASPAVPPLSAGAVCSLNHDKM